MGRIADIPREYWITCVELRPGGRTYVAPGLCEFLTMLERADPSEGGPDPLLGRWRISVTAIDRRVPLAAVLEQYVRDGQSFPIRKTLEVDLGELAREWQPAH